MSISRRELMKIGALSGVAAMIPSQLMAAGDIFTVPRDAHAEPWMSRALITPQIGARFDVSRDGTLLASLRLDDVVALSGRKSADNRFSARFSGPAKQTLGQGTYRFDHATIGSFDAFLVPVDRTGRRQNYEVIVNRTGA